MPCFSASPKSYYPNGTLREGVDVEIRGRADLVISGVMDSKGCIYRIGSNQSRASMSEGFHFYGRMDWWNFIFFSRIGCAGFVWSREEKSRALWQRMHHRLSRLLQPWLVE